MGFSIGRFLGAIAGPVVGLATGNPLLGAAVSTGILSGRGASAQPGRTTAPPPPPTARPAQVPALSSTVPIPNRLSRASLVSTTRIPVRLPRVGPGTAMSLFGNGNGQRSPLQQILGEARENIGGSVTRNQIIDAARTCGLELTAETFGLDVEQVCFVVMRGKTRRRRGISAADIRRTKRVIRFTKSLKKDLTALKGR